MVKGVYVCVCENIELIKDPILQGLFHLVGMNIAVVNKSRIRPSEVTVQSQPQPAYDFYGICMAPERKNTCSFVSLLY